MSTSLCPLYDILLAELIQNQEKGNSIELEKVAASINTIKLRSTPEQTTSHYEDIASLIIHHWAVEHPGEPLPSNLPYKHTTMHKGIGPITQMKFLTPQLCGIIAMYVERYKD